MNNLRGKENMYCNQCGARLDETMAFCSGCGNKLQDEGVSDVRESVNPTQESQPEVQATYIESQEVESKSKFSSIIRTIIGVIIVIGAITVISNLFFGGSNNLSGTWVLYETSGNLPASTANTIVFTGERGGGTGHFIDAFWGTRVDFDWRASNTEFFMSRVPGAEGTVGIFHGATYEINPRRDRITIRYGNGSIAIFRKQ